jgi:hypothetical protein
MTLNESAPHPSEIPARPDRLGWSPFHARSMAGLRAALILDGLRGGVG